MDSASSKAGKLSKSLTAAIQLAAPQTWTASLGPALYAVLLCALRGYPLGAVRALLLIPACVLLQSAVNTLNDYFDFVKGADSADDCVEKSDATLVYGDAEPKRAFVLGLAYLAAGACLGLIACVNRGPMPLLIGLAGVLVVWCYSAGPLPLSYLPCGELVSGLMMGGLIPLGIAACADGALHAEVLVFSLPLVLGIALIMMSNNGCDIEKDGRAGRRTLPLLLGRERSLRLYRGLCAVWLALLILVPVWLAGPSGLLSVMLLILFGTQIFRRLFSLALLPEERIRQMKTVNAANMIGAVSMIAALAARLLAEVLHG